MSAPTTDVLAPSTAPPGMADPPDSARGHLDARALFVAHGAFVGAFLRRMGATTAEVEDLVQDVFLIAHRKGGYSPGPARPTTWLASIALGELRNARRKHQRRQVSSVVDSEAVDRATADDAADPRVAIDRADRVALVNRALDRLPEDRRALFLLFELEGESCASIAAGLGIPVGTVYSRLHAARRAFAAAVKELGDRA